MEIELARRISRRYVRKASVDFGQFDVVWHESNVDGLTELEARNPTYDGSAGPGIYVSPHGTNNVYGQHTYKCQLRFNPGPSTIFVITPSASHVEVSSYEAGQIFPFSVVIKGDKYWVGPESSLKYHLKKQRIRKFLSKAAHGDLPWPLEEEFSQRYDGYEVSSFGIPTWFDGLLDRPIEALGIERQWRNYLDESADNPDPSALVKDLWREAVDAYPNDYTRISGYDISRTVESYGYEAVYVKGMRRRVDPGEDVELIIFDQEDVEIIEQVK